MLSIVIPTYNEHENIREIITALVSIFEEHSIKAEIIVVDDNSPDGTASAVEKIAKDNPSVRLVRRKGKQGLSSAVLDGWKQAQGEILGVIDADLSHPVSKIAAMLKKIEHSDIVIGSRYIKGGKIKGWSIFRKIISKGATIIARTFTDVKDPMSGFFLIRKQAIDLDKINPKGFKILLEILVKSRSKDIYEIPITFNDRVKGKSKISHLEILWFLTNIINYLMIRKDISKQFLTFASIGFIGTLLNFMILYTLTEYGGIWYMFSAIFAFIAAMVHNFIFNKIFTFKEQLTRKIHLRFFRFASVSISALAINLAILYTLTEYVGLFYMLSQAVAIGTALVINFLGNKVWTFSRY